MEPYSFHSPGLLKLLGVTVERRPLSLPTIAQHGTGLCCAWGSGQAVEGREQTPNRKWVEYF